MTVNDWNNVRTKSRITGTRNMRLEALKLTNFRRFNDLTISFHPELTVIAAGNSVGKTAVLDAATIALGTYVGAFDLSKSTGISKKDARYHRPAGRSDSEQVFPVRLEARLSNPNGTVVRELNGAKNRTTVKDAALLTAHGKELMAKVRDLAPLKLPLVAYYGSGRLWSIHKNMTREAVLSESRTMGYEDCLSSASNFTQVQQWMTKATFAALQQRSMRAYGDYKTADQIQGIQRAVDTVLRNEGWSGFHYSVQHEELAMTHEELGLLPVSMLSDGVRAVVSLVADMAWRCAKLNPEMGAEAQQTTEGIAFIDEVDMHLHPKCQQTVISSLRKAFPVVQFVVTTHSPQVLSTVKSESIRLLSNDPDPETSEMVSTAQIPDRQSRGVASSDVMAELQCVNPVPNVEEACWLKEYRALITLDQCTPEENGKKQVLKEKILAHFGESHAEWLECLRLSRMQEMKARIRGKRQIIRTEYAPMTPVTGCGTSDHSRRSF